MTLLGKILTVAIFVMSIAFMAFAVMVYATHKNWKDLVISTDAAKPGLKMQLETAFETNRQLRAQLNQLQQQVARERAARQAALARLEQSYDTSRQQLANREAEFAALQATHGEMVKTMQTEQNLLASLTTEVGGLRNDIRTTQQDRDSQFEMVYTLTDQMHQAKGTEFRLTERNTELTRTVGDYKRALDSHGIRPNDPLKVPSLDGQVTAVTASGDRIEISLGDDDGLKVGHLLEVSRRGQFVGRVQVVFVNADRAVGVVLKEFLKTPIQKGDNVFTKVD